MKLPEVEVLVFEMEGNQFGIPIDQIDVMSLEDSGSDDLRLDTLMGYPGKKALQSPKNVKIKSGFLKKIKIERVLGIQSIVRSAIREIPPHMSRQSLSGLITSVAERKGGQPSLLILDLKKLKN